MNWRSSGWCSYSGDWREGGGQTLEGIRVKKSRNPKSEIRKRSQGGRDCRSYSFQVAKSNCDRIARMRGAEEDGGGLGAIHGDDCANGGEGCAGKCFEDDPAGG